MGTHPAAGNDALPEVLADLADLVDADCAIVEVYDRQTGAPVLMENARVDLGQMSAYAAEYASLSPRVRYGRSPGALPISHDALILSEREMDLDPYYADYLAPVGLRYFLAMSVDPDPGSFGVLSLQFRPSQGPADAE